MSAQRQRRPIVKLILLGDSGVGKTSLVRQYLLKRYEPRYKATIGADFCNRDIEIDGVVVNVQIWDTAGQERFQSLGTAFYRGADACVLVFDITNQDSFAHMNTWLSEFTFQAGNDKEIILIGNKCDVQEKREVFQRPVQEWCMQNGRNDGEEPIRYFEASAKENTCVTEAFTSISEAAHRRKSKRVVADVPTSVGPWSALRQQPAKSKKESSCGGDCAK